MADLPQLADFVGARHLNAATIAGYLWCLMLRRTMGDAAAHCSCQPKTFARLQSAKDASPEEKQLLGLNKLQATPFPVYRGDILDLYTYGTQHMHLEGIVCPSLFKRIQTPACRRGACHPLPCLLFSEGASQGGTTSVH
jgi:hypothetical protein